MYTIGGPFGVSQHKVAWLEDGSINVNIRAEIALRKEGLGNWELKDIARKNIIALLKIS